MTVPSSSSTPLANRSSAPSTSCTTHEPPPIRGSGSQLSAMSSPSTAATASPWPWSPATVSWIVSRTARPASKTRPSSWQNSRQKSRDGPRRAWTSATDRRAPRRQLFPMTAAERAALRELPDGEALCHGDFHPRNVIVDGDELTIIDWVDASSGPPAADLARSAIIFLGSRSATSPVPCAIAWIPSTRRT